MPQELNATTVDLVYNNSSGIANAYLTATLNDGTILGFAIKYNNEFFLCGAISQQAELSIPDSVFYSSGRYAVKRVGYENRCDFDNAKNVTSLTLPATITTINSLPSTVKVLHTKGYISNLNSEKLSNLNKVLVPESTLNSYLNDKKWSNYVLINAEGTNPLSLTVKMTKAGEFAQLLLQQTDKWDRVNELTVIGNLNDNDLNVFKRMRNLTKLDLSRAIITNIPNQFDGAYGSYSERNGFNLLEDLSLPEVNSIGDYAFAKCYRLRNINIPKVNTIGTNSFLGLGASHITLPEGVKLIGSNAFLSCI